MRAYVTRASVGVAVTMSGAVSVGGDGKWRNDVKAAVRSHGMRMHPLTGEWHHPDGSLYPQVLASLEAL